MNKLLVFLAAALVAGCYTTRDIPAGQIHKIQHGQHERELILRTDKGKPVRFGPRSTIRFQLTDRRWTGWFRGHRLRVNRAGVCVEKGCTPPHKGWLWDQIQSAQVKNLSGGRTYAAVFITVAVVAVTVAIIAATVSGKGGGKKLPNIKGLIPRGSGGRVLRSTGRVGRGVGRVGRGAGRISGLRPRGGPRTGGLRPRGGPRAGGLRPRVGRPRRHGHHPAGRLRGSDVADTLDGLPQPEPDPDDHETRGATDAERSPGVPSHLSLHATPGQTSAIFARRTRRRARIRFIGLVEGGGDLILQDGGNTQALVGMRILDVLELAGGAHLMIHRGGHETGKHHASWIGVLRLNLHFDVDSRRRVALPIGVDVGVGQATFYARLNLGLRVRLTRHLSLGVYPFNPTYAEFKDTTLRRRCGWWSFPSTIDLSFAL